MAPQQSFAQSLARVLDMAEMVLLAMLMTGIIFLYMDIGLSGNLIVISLGGLAGVFFLLGFRPPVNIGQPEGDKKGFADLFIQTTMPKIMWISCAICAVSLLLFHRDMGNEGYKPGLMIHSVITTAGLVIIGLGMATGMNQIRSLFPILLRAVPLLLAAVYLLRGELTALLS